MNIMADDLFGVTGHQTLSANTQVLISEAIRSELRGARNPVLLTSLAAGADQICAQAVLDVGGRLRVVLPARRYEESFNSDIDAANFKRLLALAEEVIPMPFEQPAEEAYWAAGREIVDRAGWILAVWDGKPAGGLGGTADVVKYAWSKGKKVVVIWPEGASRY